MGADRPFPDWEQVADRQDQAAYQRQERIARLWQMPLDLVVLYAQVTHALVEVVIERWATGRYVPSACEPSWVVELADDAELAARLPLTAVPPA